MTPIQLTPFQPVTLVGHDEIYVIVSQSTHGGAASVHLVEVNEWNHRRQAQGLSVIDYQTPTHDPCATVLADRERELLEIKGPCSTRRCRLHYAHSGPCDIRSEAR